MTGRSHLGALALCACLAWSAAAYAGDGPRRDGFAIGIGLGTGLVQSAGLDGVGGPGGAAHLYVGTSAGERLMWLLELHVAADPRSIGGDADASIVNQLTLLTLGGQYYVREAAWVRAGAGLSALALGRDRDAPDSVDRTMNGLGVAAAGGYELLHSGIFALGLDAVLAVGLFGEGAVASLSLGLSANWH